MSSGAWQSPNNDLHAVNNTITKTNGKYSYPAKIQHQRCRLLEWILFKDPPNGLIPKSDELFTTLQEIQKPQECTRDREEFRTSEHCLRLNEALATR